MHAVLFRLKSLSVEDHFQLIKEKKKMESNFQNTSNNLKEEEEDDKKEKDEIQKSKKRKLNEEEDEEDENEDNDQEDNNQLDDQLLLNILNHLMKNKIQEKKSFVSQLSNFLDSDHDERGEFIKKKFFYTKDSSPMSCYSK